MEANQNDSQKKEQETKSSLKTDNNSAENVNSNDQSSKHPRKHHSSEGHTTDAKGVVSNTRESTLRSATTDSTRAPKNGADEGASGGNIR
ncbi:hypothetical protein ACFSKU_03495 [Pontibacter silvestris]|uniref:Uncharacterized protein n=1 Tax=Pontibacter silvestris TaxID=2305183 RepID=A0ABW4WTE6_9BACT|nr:hypothetical protein [Pontibacter silvestris]MCC9138749.1 hypothetical protein [Pontibacter silvestris]